MAYDEELAQRVREELASRPDVQERRMFGGLAFMLSGNMACGVVGDRLMLRLGKEGAAAALCEPQVSPMDFTGTPSATMVYLEPAGCADATLASWIARAVAFVDALPVKVPGPPGLP
jgi:TfoX/Sxy family transcriptional regulator of competence genes